MNYISANINLEDYVGKHVNLDMSGTRRKFNVVPLDDTVVYPSSAILLNNAYSILGVSTVQDCPSCSATVVIWDAVPERFVTIGDIINLSVTTRGSSEGLNYQWYRNNIPIDGATSLLYTLPPFDPSYNGNTFKLGITGLCNTAYSENKVWLGTTQNFATACNIKPDNLFYYDFKENRFHYNTLYGDYVNGDWFNYTQKYTFNNGFITLILPTCIDNPFPPINVDESIPVTTPRPVTTTPCPCSDYNFDASCFPAEDDTQFTLSYCCGLFYDGSTPYTGSGYRYGYQYDFVAGQIQGDGSRCTTTTPAPCTNAIYDTFCGEGGSTVTLYKCKEYWYTELPAKAEFLVENTYAKDGFLYQFQVGVIVSISICPPCQPETFTDGCSDGAGSITYYVKNNLYFGDSESCATYDPTNPDSVPTGLVDGSVAYSGSYPYKTEYEFGNGVKGEVGPCPAPTTTTPTPECCAYWGYEPSPLSEWGSDYSSLTVECPTGGTKNCYQYKTPTTTPHPTTTTPAPCSTGTIAVPSTNNYDFLFDGYGNINITYSPQSNPLFPVTLNAAGGTPYSVYSSDCVAGTTNLYVVAGCYSVGSSCATTTPTPTTTPDPCPPYGTSAGTVCIGVDLYNAYADGICGTYTILAEANSISCGYVPPTTTSAPPPPPTTTLPPPPPTTTLPP